MSEQKIGPITEKERQEVLTWQLSEELDVELLASIAGDKELLSPSSTYLIIRALRAGVKLEDLL